jgi:hypothetical protein
MRSSTLWNRVALLVGLVWLSLVALIAPAQAQEIVDRATGFLIRAEVPGARVCVVLPRGMDTPEGCADHDVAVGRQQVEAAQRPAKVSVVSVVWVTGPQNVAITITSLPSMNNDGLRGILDGFENAARAAGGPSVSLHGDAPGSRHDELRVNGLRALRFTWERVTPEDGPGDHSLAYIIVGSRSTIGVTFLSSRADAPAVRLIAERMMATVFLPSAPAAPGGPARSDAYELGYMMGQVAIFGAIFVGLIAAWIGYERRAAPALGAAARPTSAARGSWLSVVAATGMMIFGRTGAATTGVVGVFGSLLMLLGFLAGLYALASVPRHGRAGILVPALIGVSLNVLLFAAATVASNY